MAVIRIDHSSEDYRRFEWLYRAARAFRPSGIDRWNGELYATVGEGENWGSLHPDGYFKLSKELVFDRLGPDTPTADQAEALATILHESHHARVEVNAADEPNAVLSRHSKALDEGLTEWVAVGDLEAFSRATGYGRLRVAQPENPAAFHATESLLEYAAGDDGMDDLAARALDQPVVMRWNVIAEGMVKNRLGDVVPTDPRHQQAARAELINAMTQPSWELLDKARAMFGPTAARETTHALDEATARIRQHYAQNPGQPYPSRTPNMLMGRQTPGGVQQRTVGHGGQVDLTQLPPPNAASRVDGTGQTARPESRRGAARPGPSGPRTGRSMRDFAPAARSTPGGPQGGEMRLLSGSAPAAHATQRRPQLGNGGRGAGAPGGADMNRPAVDRGTRTMDRGRQ